MPKKIGNIYDKAIDFYKFKEAYERTSKSKKNKKDRIYFGMYLEDNIYRIGTDLKQRKYEVGKYSKFKVYIPKEREIYCLNFYDRVVQQWYVHEFILPYMIDKFIVDSFACIKGRGVHGAINKLQKYMCIAKRKWENPYILKYDIKKFFYSIDQKKLYEIMCKYYKDKDFLDLTRKFIKFDPENKNDNEFGVGIPIGNYTSQFFANIYMNELDQFIKHKLRVKYYVRYMDDGVLILESKGKAKEILKEIEEFVKTELHLQLNKKTSYFPLKVGVIFCGYKIYTTHKLLKRANIQRMKKRIKNWNKQYRINENDLEQLNKWRQSFFAWKGYAKEAEKYNLYKTLENKCEWIDTEHI